MQKKFAYFGNETVGSAISDNLERAGYERVDTVDQADAVCTYCTSQTALEDTYLGDDGLVQGAPPGTLLIDFSASTPGFARELSAVAMVSDLIPVEAPLLVLDITATDAFAERDNLACFLAGEEGAIEAALELLEAAVGSVQQTGGSGSAQLARAAYTLQNTAQIVSSIEANALYYAFQRSTSSDEAGRVGATTPVAEQVLEAVLAERFEGTYTVEMFMAELSAALTAADDMDLILPQAESSLHLLELLAVIGGADKAPTALSLVYGEEDACARAGLDWTRAEQAYGENKPEYYDGFDDIDDVDCDDDHDSYSGYSGPYGSYSAN